MVSRLMPRSPWRRIRLASIAAGLMAKSIRSDQFRHRQLGTSHGCQDHTVLPYASAPYVLRAVSAHGRTRPANNSSRLTLPRPPHPIPTFVTMANAPLLRDGMADL